MHILTPLPPPRGAGPPERSGPAAGRRARAVRHAGGGLPRPAEPVAAAGSGAGAGGVGIPRPGRADRNIADRAGAGRLPHRPRPAGPDAPATEGRGSAAPSPATEVRRHRGGVAGRPNGQPSSLGQPIAASAQIAEGRACPDACPCSANNALQRCRRSRLNTAPLEHPPLGAALGRPRRALRPWRGQGRPGRAPPPRAALAGARTASAPGSSHPPRRSQAPGRASPARWRKSSPPGTRRSTPRAAASPPGRSSSLPI